MCHASPLDKRHAPKHPVAARLFDAPWGRVARPRLNPVCHLILALHPCYVGALLGREAGGRSACRLEVARLPDGAPITTALLERVPKRGQAQRRGEETRDAGGRQLLVPRFGSPSPLALDWP